MRDQWIMPSLHVRLSPRLLGSELVLPALLLFFLSLPLLSRLVGGSARPGQHSDHLDHLRYAHELVEKGKFQPHPLYHCLVVLFSFGNPTLTMGGIAVVVLALALAARAYLTALLMTDANAPPLPIVLGLCLCLALAMPLPNWWQFPAELFPDNYARYFKELPSPVLWKIPVTYRGQVSPNVWHNPTAIFAMPFALWLFLLAIQALRDPRTFTMGAMGFVMALNLLAKPNYVLSFAPCLAVAALAVWYQSIRTGRLTLPAAVGQACLAFAPAIAILSFQFRNAFGAGITGESKVVLDPLTSWSKFSHNIPASILLGIVFPAAVAALYPRRVIVEPKLLLAWAVLAVALAEFALLAEVGDRSTHGNFHWGAVLADQVLFVVCTDFLLRQPASLSRKLAFAVLGLHVLSGSLYLTRSLFIPAMQSEF
jgi:hypothetical protein